MKKNKILMFVGSFILTVLGFVMVPKFINKYSNRLYKASLEKEEFDFDDMEPEIVKKEE